MSDMNILIVDDSPLSRMMLRRTIHMAAPGAKVHVTEAADGLHALEHLQTRKGGFDLVITDLNMPRMDGETLVKEMRKTDSPPVIVVSSLVNASVVTRLRLRGATAVLKKPFDPNALASAMRTALAARCA